MYFTDDVHILNYIDGKLIPSVKGKSMPNTIPATGTAYGTIPLSDEQDVDLAVEAARKAFPTWKNKSIDQRSEILSRIAAIITEQTDMLAFAESTDNGKPLTLATRVDIPRAASNISFFATAIKHFHTESHPNPDFINYTTREPIGVVGCISPWNLPLYLFTWKIAPALAAGNCVIAKPSEITPLTAYLFSKICIQAGLPEGVLNIVHGLGAEVGNAIVSHPSIKAISFTGGTATGKHITSIAAPMFKKLSLELGGKNPNIIFADCDFEDMMQTTLHSSFSNQGQICLCGSRILVEQSLYTKFKDEFVKRVKELKVGKPLDKDTKIGAIVSKPHFEKILSCIQLAKDEGGKILCGGEPVQLDGDEQTGYYIAPTVIENLSMTCRTNQEEIFGPVVTIMPFENIEEAIQLANATPYGLAATIWTSHLQTAHRVAHALETGIVWINCWLQRDLRTPFGGVKASGVGREGGTEALRFFTEPKNICIKL